MSTRIDMSREAEARRQSEVDARLARVDATGAARAEARRKISADVEAEEIATATAAAARAEADAERARIGAVVRVGRDRDRGQQALRAALLAPIGAAAATGLIEALPTDATASPEALAVPGFAAFGSPAAQAERKRIASAFSRPEAEGRFGAVVALVLDGDAGLTADQIAPLLATMPTGPARRIAGPGERAEGMAEFGGDTAPRMSKAEANAAGWKKAAAEANASIGAGPKVTAQGLAVAALATDPHIGLTSEGRAAAEALLRARG